MSIDKFKAEIKSTGLARTNRFLVEFGLPKSIQKDVFNLELVHLYCESAVLPSLNLATQPNRSFGEQREIVYDRNFESITLTFHIDSSLIVKDFFDSWLNTIISPYSRTASYYDSYVTEMTVSVLDLQDKKTYKVVLYEVYPKTISQVALSHNSKDVMSLSVTFNYKYHLSSRLDRLGGDASIYNQFNIDKNESFNDGLGIPIEYYTGPSNSTMSKENYDNEISRLEARANSLAVSRVMPTMVSTNPQGIDTYDGDFYVGGP